MKEKLWKQLYGERKVRLPDVGLTNAERVMKLTGKKTKEKK